MCFLYLSNVEAFKTVGVTREMLRTRSHYLHTTYPKTYKPPQCNKVYLLKQHEMLNKMFRIVLSHTKQTMHL